MVLSAHAVVGGAIGALVRGNPLVAFLYGFISHFILDMIPHYDYPIRSGFVDPHGEDKKILLKQILLDTFSVGFDILLGIVLAYIFFEANDPTYSWLFGAVGAIVPDALQFVYGLWKKPPLTWLQKVHEAVHTNIKFKKNPFIGMSVQVFFVFLVIYFVGGHLSGIEGRVLRPSVGEVDATIEATDQASTTVLFLGDIMLGRYVETLRDREGNDYPFREIRAFLEKYDVVIGNLEGPVRRVHVPTPPMSFSFSFDHRVPALLASSSIDAVSLANNHTHDSGAGDFMSTVQKLNKAGVASFGHPIYEADSYFEFDTPKHRVMVLGFNSTFPSFDLSMASEVVKSVKQANPDSIIVVFMHWGDEYIKTNNPEQRRIAESLIANGAKVVVGAHPHVSQNIEEIGGGLVIYSLGNFIFDQYFSEETKKGTLAEFEIGSDEMVVRIHEINSVLSQPFVEKEKIAQYRLSI